MTLETCLCDEHEVVMPDAMGGQDITVIQGNAMKFPYLIYS